ncbi:MAG: phenylalanine--tRNA ligase subunit beta [Acidobacteria bacterium]|nr:phenylalanine--tRNA ligase subunit beta [Acidobacteriota bacterium]
MKFSYNWIRDLVDGLDTAPEALKGLITMKTAECESIEDIGSHLGEVSTARVMAVEAIEGTRNVKASVDTARYGVKQVVCGAPNCRPGMITAYVPAGTKLGGLTIEKRVVNGIESDGMLASGAELGLNRDSEGILELTGAPGAAIPGCPPDAVIEIDNKSLTHRPDLWGHHGMAREVAAITQTRLKDPADLSRIPAGESPVKIEIPDFTLCPRYSALVFENVTVQPSPLWLQYRLVAIGLNPINNIVDVTNFIMAELAQPMHAFDAEKLVGDTIHARPAREGEAIVALNGEKYELSVANLVIADESGPIAIAGVIGGLDSAISDSTTRIVFESANFHAANVRKTSSRLKLRTDASMRFEKSQDPVNTVRGLARAVELLEQVSPGIRVVGGLADSWQQKPAPPPILLPLDWLDRKLGRRIEEAEVISILESLEFGVGWQAPGVLSVTVPSWRATKDVALKDDLVEEIGRIIGYGSITPTAPMVAAKVPPANIERQFQHDVRALLTAQGYTEVYNYSFISEEAAARFHYDPEALVVVANPIASDQSLMRPSLLPGVWKNLLDNARNFETFRLFEIGQEIHKAASEAELPEQVSHLAVAYSIRQEATPGAALFELKRVAECLMPGAAVRPAEPRSFEHPARVRAARQLFGDRLR